MPALAPRMFDSVSIEPPSAGTIVAIIFAGIVPVLIIICCVSWLLCCWSRNKFCCSCCGRRRRARKPEVHASPSPSPPRSTSSAEIATPFRHLASEKQMQMPEAENRSSLAGTPEKELGEGRIADARAFV